MGMHDAQTNRHRRSCVNTRGPSTSSLHSVAPQLSASSKDTCLLQLLALRALRCQSTPAATHRLADGGQLLHQQLVVMSNLHQLHSTVAVVDALVGLGLQACTAPSVGGIHSY